jgi:hypothetical protein
MNSKSIEREVSRGFVRAMMFVMLLAAWSARAQTQPCPETNGVKWLAPPQVDGGWDVKDSRDNIVLADDFACTTTGPITDIHIWGSWLSDVHGVITNFWLGIYDDVPAVTNLPSGSVTPSHPGTKLLWQQSFLPTQFAENFYAVGSEQFYDPATQGILGSDSQAWYYCFYPTNPFVQQGLANQPTNYWLAARAQLAPDQSLYGWKTSLRTYNDAAVWGTVGANGLPAGNWQSMTNFQTQQPINLAFKLTTPTNAIPTNCCPEINGVKWVQWPDVFAGFDINASQGQTLADDFGCTTTGPIADIRLWGSWLNDNLDPNATFTLTFWSDVPVSPGNPASHPGTNLWSQTFGPGQYGICLYTNLPEPFYTPTAAGGLILSGNSTKLYYLCFTPDPASTFYQRGTPNAPTNYWLSVNVQTAPTGVLDFGWKTSITNYNDTAVWGNGLLPAFWTSIYDPRSGKPVDMSFKITTLTNPIPTVPCVETNGVKYVQWPNLIGGADVWNSSTFPPNVTDGPWWLADDFTCTNAGPITDIHLWGSWLNDQFLTNRITFQLYVFDDVPTNAASPFSHPGTNVLWHQTFAPGSYAEVLWTPNASEYFLDPGPPQILGGDSMVWYYCFYPTKPFVQQGSLTSPRTYWLAAFAELPTGVINVFGWKTTTNVQHDISVHSPWAGFGVPPTNSLAWQPTYEFRGPEQPLDLAFKLTTDTNCVVAITCPGDKRVECGSPWVFDPPVVGPDPCCPNNPSVTFSAVTNILGPCNQSITGTWVITNCTGLLKVCTQTVTVTDTIPPVLNCTNLVLACGDYSYTNPPAAFDRCCGSNVTVTLVTSQIINSNCGQTISQLWRATDCCSNSAECVRMVSVVAGLGKNLVVPNTNATVEGNSGNIYPFNIGANDMRYQQVYASSQFGAVPPGGAFLTAIAFRVDAGWGAFAATLPGVQINLSTTTKAPDGLDTTFANNVGLNDTLVYSGSLTLSSAASGSPAAFDIVIPLTPPFWYNPAAGNLLLDVRNSGGGTSQQFDAVSTTNDSVSRVYGLVGGSTGGTDTLGLVTEFTLGVGTISLICPSNIVVYTCDTNPVVVTWPTNLASDTCSRVTVTSTPPSGTAFKPNTTNTVVVTAYDDCGNTNRCSFTVQVRRPVLGPITVTTIPTNKVVLTWTDGMLQSTTNIVVPFTDVPGATSPYTNSTVPPPVARFYRLRCSSP